MATTVVLQGIKVNAAVSSTSSSSTGIKYTAPATGYAIVNIYCGTATANLTIAIGGQTVYTATGTTTVGLVLTSFYVGPSQTINLTVSTVTCNIVGTEFINF